MAGPRCAALARSGRVPAKPCVHKSTVSHNFSPFTRSQRLRLRKADEVCLIGCLPVQRFIRRPSLAPLDTRPDHMGNQACQVCSITYRRTFISSRVASTKLSEVGSLDHSVLAQAKGLQSREPKTQPKNLYFFSCTLSHNLVRAASGCSSYSI